ncbi:hypothetical protein FA13DRAFT_1714398 [Coprinellus micaceus]|uniref:Uncharacterized protein n=1 Tax=Coprinellus micaceus TaxID=71717 RepID=A0A4Y7ST08_COPMI|nr:hypothetical protein FA13DRAFT_1714398 [Coprinellus micaceus]
MVHLTDTIVHMWFRLPIVNVAFVPIPFYTNDQSTLEGPPNLRLSSGDARAETESSCQWTAMTETMKASRSQELSLPWAVHLIVSASKGNACATRLWLREDVEELRDQVDNIAPCRRRAISGEPLWALNKRPQLFSLRAAWRKTRLIVVWHVSFGAELKAREIERGRRPGPRSYSITHTLPAQLQFCCGVTGSSSKNEARRAPFVLTMNELINIPLTFLCWYLWKDSTKGKHTEAERVPLVLALLVNDPGRNQRPVGVNFKELTLK